MEAGDYEGVDEEEALMALKISGLASEYEHLLLVQLGEQRRHFEQLLAKEISTVAAAAMGDDDDEDEDEDDAVDGAGGDDEICSGGRGNGRAGSRWIQRNRGRETSHNSSNTTNKRSRKVQPTDEERAAVMQLRRELSELEAEEEAVKGAIREEEAMLRAARKAQAQLLRAQRRKERKWEALRMRVGADQRECEAVVQELKDQIQDLALYSRTQSEVDQSPHKDEIRSGQVVTWTRPNRHG